MKVFLSLMALLFTLTACDYRQYPQEEEWKDEVQELGDEKKN